MLKGLIHFTEKNVHGAWVVYGAIGVRQYYGHTKKEAEEKYKEECKQNMFTNVKQDAEEYRKELASAVKAKAEKEAQKQIADALQLLGYDPEAHDVSLRTVDGIRFAVYVEGEYFGTWDADRKTFVD